MANLEPFWSIIIMASAAFLGAVIGATVRPLFDHLVQKWQRKSTWRRDATCPITAEAPHGRGPVDCLYLSFPGRARHVQLVTTLDNGCCLP